MHCLRKSVTGGPCKQYWPTKHTALPISGWSSTRHKGVTTATGTGRDGQVSEQQRVAAPTAQEDAFTIASMRLKHLLSEASWDTNEAVRAELSTYTPAMKLTFLTNCSSFATLMAIAVSWITGEDPLGGVTLTSDTVHAAGVGLLAALPLVAASLMLRTQPAKRAVPLVADLHATQATLLQPLLKDLNLPQLLIASSFTVMPVLLLLFPTMHGIAAMAMAIAEPDLVVQPVTATIAAVQDTAAATPAGADDFILQHMLRYDLTNTDVGSTGSGFTAVGGETWDAWKAAGLDQLDNAEGSVADAANQLLSTGAAAAEEPGLAEPTSAGWQAAVAWAWAMHSTPLTPPMLLPQGVPDFLEILQDQVDALFDPSTSRLVRNVGLEATSLAPAIMSGFLAAYTVMRQLAPRGSQIRAIRDALTASDRYFRLHVSMNRATSKSAQALKQSSTARGASGEGESGSGACSSSSREDALRERLQDMPSSSAAFTRAGNEMMAHGSMAAAAGSSVALSGATEGVSLAVSDAFRKVAVMWLLTRRKVCQLAYMLTALNILYFALLWQETGNLATPATTAVVCVLVEMWCCQHDPEASA